MDTLVDRLLAFNRAFPGYFALTLASTISTPLARALAELQAGVMENLDAVLAARWPESTPAQRHLPALVSQRIFVALLPLALAGDSDRQRAIVGELKTVLFRYWVPLIATLSDPLPPVPGGHDAAGQDRGRRGGEEAGGGG